MRRRTFRSRLGLVAAVAVAGAVVGPVGAHAAGTASAGATGVRADFNGDGYADLAVAAPWGMTGGYGSSGYVSVVYGSSKGLDTRHRQLISQDTPGIPDTAETGDSFGWGLTFGDLDGDGYTDLVVGAPGEGVGSVRQAGSLTVVWGGKTGLSGGKVVATGTMFDQVEPRHATVGDFNGDGHLDVAADNHLLSGPFTRTSGAAATGTLTFDTDYETDNPYAIDDVAAGDVDHDGITDLVGLVHTPDEEGPGVGYRVEYLRGTRQGPSAPVELTRADGTLVPGGSSLGIGDVNKDGYADLVIGRPVGARGEESVEPARLGGQVGVVYGSAKGPDTSRTTVINQNTVGVPGVSEKGDDFGLGISIGDVNGDGYADVAVGTPGEAIGTVASAGAVAVLRGGASGLTGSGAVSFSQNTTGVPGTAEKGDLFGGYTALADTDHDGRAELYVSAYGENTLTGVVWAFRSTSTGPTASGSVSFGPVGFGAPYNNAHFGYGFAR
ncbi:FG-GAP-like repeat-containing protein [Streptomyces sp. NPDC091209]|uniref:FG-GAP-like repeat-containing protein n=1 Tax=Streptomyces sp. NPDC091209 TaxID=3365974 RepID=UPI003801CC8C